jgi:outer membrane protein assembly factor BamE (lipoprotein component of BamABCDE complex)
MKPAVTSSRFSRRGLSSLGLIMVAALALGLSGCLVVPVKDQDTGFARNNIGKDTGDRIKPGVATREDVMLLLGQPDSVSPDNRKYVYRAEKIYAIWMVASYGGAMGGDLTKNQYFIVTFDEHGVVQTHEFSTHYMDDASKVDRALGGNGSPIPPAVLNLAPRTQRAQPAPAKFAIHLVPLTDAREETNRIGERTQLVKSMNNDVHSSQNVPDYFSAALADELQLMGGRIVKTGEDLQVSARLTKFWVTTDVTLLYWDITASVECDLSITRTGSPAAPVQKHFAGQKKTRTFIWPSEKLMSSALEGSLDDLFKKLRADPIWQAQPVAAAP